MKSKKLCSIIFLVFLWTPYQVKAQITLINENYGLQLYPKNCRDTIEINYIKNYPGYRMRLFIKEYNGKASFKLLDKKGRLKIEGQFSGGKDTLSKYSFAKVLGYTNDKNVTGVRLLKYIYLLQSGTWFYYDDNEKVIRIEEYEFNFQN